MKKILIVCLILAASSVFSQDSKKKNVKIMNLKKISHSNSMQPSETFNFKYGCTVTVPDNNLNSFALVMPLPATDTWQKLESYTTSHPANVTVKKINNISLTYLYFELKDAFKKNKTIDVTITAKVKKQQKQINLDLLNTATINRNSTEYKNYTISENYINLNNPQLTKDIAPMQGKSIKEKVEYSYNLVRSRMKYVPIGKGLKQLDSIVANFEGECGDYSTYLIALLRKMGIPARHVIGRIVDKDDIYHGWVELYIDKVWIPLDPTYPEFKGKKLFGFEHSPFIVFHRGINMEIELCGFKFPFGILQAYTYTYLLKNNGRMTPAVKAIWQKK